MTGRNTNDQCFVDVYDSVIKLVNEAQNFNTDEEYSKHIVNYGLINAIKEFRTVSVKTHRASGMTTTAVRLLKKNDENILIVPTVDMKRSIRHTFELTDDMCRRIFSITELESNANSLRGQSLKPELVIIDPASFIDVYFQRKNFTCIDTVETRLKTINTNILFLFETMLTSPYELAKSLIENRKPEYLYTPDVLNGLVFDWREKYIYNLFTHLFDCKKTIFVELG